MTLQKGTKINQVFKQWPMGTVAPVSWMKTQGISRQLLGAYLKTHWIKRLGNGAVVRVDDKVDWTGGLFAIQKCLKKPIHVGGKTALVMEGYGHYGELGESKSVTLFGFVPLPTWFKQHQWEKKINYNKTSILVLAEKQGFTEKKIDAYSIRISAPERAIMEFLHLIPKKESFDEAMRIMEGLTTLRPQLVQALLEDCTSVKVKRLFLFMAESFKHQWFAKLDINGVNLGSGKRVIVKSGKFNHKYQITVPGEYVKNGRLAT